ncbi:hypothetical protein [uncultured Deinococcus sp.]|mgnify:FL=1|uniref:hypothetical protein n=1 Tax=uncultured Deinococcus sp. TaxID=158789 RepID=UPI0025FA10B2|nr:hypothetical protein [uncultured Deinococcus sp.]
MYQPQLNYDQARLKLDHLHHEARVAALVQGRRNQARGGLAAVRSWFVSGSRILSQHLLHVLHLDSA